MPGPGRTRRCLLPVAVAAVVAGAVGLGRSPPARAQLSDIEREWRVLQQAQSAHARGRVAAERGDSATAETELSTAAELYRQLLEQNSLRRDLYAPLADTLIRRNNSAAAYALLSQQIRSGNKEPAVQLELVRALQGMHRHRHAFDEANKLAQTNPKNPVFMALLGEAAAEAGESELGIKVLGQVLEKPLPPGPLQEAGLSTTMLRLTQARLLLGANRPTEAVTVLAELIKAQNPEALLLLGQAQLHSEHPDEAVVTLRRCLAVASGGAATAAIRSRATALLGQVLAKNGHTKEAIEVMRQAGDDPTVMLGLAHLYLSDSPPNPAAALMVVERAAQIDPHDQHVCLERASLFEQTGRKPAAATELARCATLAPPAGAEQGMEALLLRADVELRLGRIDEGIASLRSGLGHGPHGPGGSAALTERLSQALLQRGLQGLRTPPLPAMAMQDLEEAYKLAPTAQSGLSLGLGLLAAGKARDAVALLGPLTEKNPTEPRLLGAYGRALRESEQLEPALAMLQRAEAVLMAGAPNPPLRMALRQEQAAAQIALGRPLDALKLIDGNDATALRARAQALLLTVRAFYASPAAASLNKSNGATARGPFPPLRGALELPQPQLAQKKLPLLRGPFPPLRGGLELPELSASAISAAALAHGIVDEHQVLTFAQQALRLGTLTESERGEAMLYQVLALFHNSQFALALRLMAEIATQIDLPTLDGLLGPGGFADLKAQIALRGGDFYNGVGLAQQALPLLKPAAARVLQNTLASSYTNKAIEMLERNEVERANLLLRNAWQQAHGGPPENLARANYNLAVLQLYRGKLEDARTALLRLDPQTLPEVWLGLGCYHDLLGDGQVALDAYRHYVQAAEPNDPQLPRVKQWIDVLERVHGSPQL